VLASTPATPTRSAGRVRTAARVGRWDAVAAALVNARSIADGKVDASLIALVEADAEPRTPAGTR
jgi:hypothetical protein